MQAEKLYAELEKDFIKKEMTDSWNEEIKEIEEYITENFKERNMGLVCDFATQINKVYTAVFPSEKVMQKILEENATNAMLFVHHPAVWDITKKPVFQHMNKELLEKFKENKISIYNLHVPLDHYGDYSTTVTLTKALNLKPQKPFAPYFGALCGVVADTELKTIQELNQKFEETIEHEIKLYEYGDKEITKIAVIAGGGNNESELKEVLKEGCNTLITGITAKSDYSKTAHEFAEKNKINLIGGTHYSTEKFACIKMVKYFNKLGLEAEFLTDDPVMEDM